MTEFAPNIDAIHVDRVLHGLARVAEFMYAPQTATDEKMQHIASSTTTFEQGDTTVDITLLEAVAPSKAYPYYRQISIDVLRNVTNQEQASQGIAVTQTDGYTLNFAAPTAPDVLPAQLLHERDYLQSQDGVFIENESEEAVTALWRQMTRGELDMAEGHRRIAALTADADAMRALIYPADEPVAVAEIDALCEILAGIEPEQRLEKPS